MVMGGKALLASTALSLTACAAGQNEVRMRAIESPLAAAAKRGTPMIAEGRGLLALGSVGLALEAFRKALRDDPRSAEALAGIAACYERMGRYDLSRVNYEAALAITPNDPVLLNSFAASLEWQGRKAEARAVRAEAAQTASVAVEPAQDASVVAEPTDRVAEAVVAAPAPAVAPVQISRVETVAAAKPAPAPEPAVAKADPVVLAPVVQQPATVASNSVTVQLPPARPATPPPAADKVLPAAPAQTQPRLERLSLGEVALLTTGRPAWRPQLVARSQRSVTVRFVPLRTAQSRPPIRVLNAARFQGLAARTRATLLERGWRKIEIGDAAQVRARSLVLYPADRKTVGRRLAAQFGFQSALSKTADGLVVLLGRDAPPRVAVRSRGW